MAGRPEEPPEAEAGRLCQVHHIIHDAGGARYKSHAANPPYQPRYHDGPAARQQANAPYLVNYLTTGLRLPVLGASSAPAGQEAGLSVLPLMTAASSPHAHPRGLPTFVIHPVAPTDDDREEPSGGPQGRCPPFWRGAQLLAGRVEAENGVPPGPKTTSARLVARGLARWGRCLISPETAQELKTTANDSSRSNEHQTAQCPGLALQG